MKTFIKNRKQYLQYMEMHYKVEFKSVGLATKTVVSG